MAKEFFPEVKKIQYEGPTTKNPLAFRHYNPEAKVGGKKMKDHLRYAVCFWHTFKGTGADPFGAGTMSRPYNAAGDPMAVAEATMRAAFELFTKLGVEFYCFHDRDIAPEADTLAETNQRLDQIVKLAKQLQQETGVKLLWGTTNAFSHPRFMAGASTNPDAHVFAWAASQVKKAMELTQELGGVNYVFWGGREGYETLLNTDLKRELEHLGQFLAMAVAHKKQLGFKGTLLIEPKPKEPTKHQYDFDAGNVHAFLLANGLEREFKLNIECNHATLAGHTFQHELEYAVASGLFGSVDANRGDELLGWDTDQFPADVYQTTLAMYTILKGGGFTTGGLNFDAKVRRCSFEPVDLFHAHVGAMDAFALGLKVAAKLLKDGVLTQFVKERYASYDAGIGAKIEKGQTSFAELEQYVLEHGEAQRVSGRQELLENILNDYLFAAARE